MTTVKQINIDKKEKRVTRQQYRDDELLIILNHLKDGKGLKEIAALMFLSVNTLYGKVELLKFDWDARNLTHLVALGYQKRYLKVENIEHKNKIIEDLKP